MTSEELEQVREINRSLPFAHPIEQGETTMRVFMAPAGLVGSVASPSLADLKGMVDVTDSFVLDSLGFTDAH